jgi:hypothetical protein
MASGEHTGLFDYSDEWRRKKSFMTLATDGRFQGLEDHHEPDEAGQHGAEGPIGDFLTYFLLCRRWDKISWSVCPWKVF